MESGPLPGIIVGHTNMDLDCFGSIALARHLFPGYAVIQSQHIHPMARGVATMYRGHLELQPSKDFRGTTVKHLVVLDTRNEDRVREYLNIFHSAPAKIDVYDHHPANGNDIPGATIHESRLGSNTSFLGRMIMERGIRITPDDATIALAGIYADTGNFTHENVTAHDFQVAAHLMAAGASMKLVKTFVSPLKEKAQISMFHQVLNDLVVRNIRGHSILLSFTELTGPTQGLSPVVEKIFEVENADAYFAVFSFLHNSSALIICRNQNDDIEVDRLMNAFGGGGHKNAASATLKDVNAAEVFETLQGFLETSIKPAITAADLMTREVRVIEDTTTLRNAARFLESIDHTGAPVVDDYKCLVGFVTLRDIQKGRRADQMHAPVKAYMTRKVVSARTTTTVREIEDLLLSNNIGHLPILDVGAVVGIVTRTDFLAHRKAEKDHIESFRGNLLE
jgi:tRNA nucleotidyltransferase (CCA-adding enzyme)